LAAGQLIGTLVDLIGEPERRLQACALARMSRIESRPSVRIGSSTLSTADIDLGTYET
jgi:hypothetical protein